jgi:N6-adenosine-specific RNA methylase IME4
MDEHTKNSTARNELIGELRMLGVQLAATEKNRDDLLWKIGDKWNEAQRLEYGKGKVLAEEIGIPYQTCAQAAYVVKRYRKIYRDDKVSDAPKPKPQVPFNAFNDAAALNDQSADELLNAYADGEFESQKDFRTAIARRKLSDKHAEKATTTEIKVEGSYSIIYADPPWSFKTFSVVGKELSADQHYPVMETEKIADLMVNGRHITEIAEKDACLFLWCTSSNVPFALNVMNAWGFTFKTTLTWDKMRPGTGYIALNEHETILYGTRGDWAMPEWKPRSVFHYPRGEHSAKPPEIREAIDRMFPKYPKHQKLELFCREYVPDWTTWGYEAKAP